MSITTEIVFMKTTEAMKEQDFIGIVDALERNYHSAQEGFLDTELLRNEDSDQWIMIQHWDSADHLKAASRKMFKDPAAEQFVKVLDPKSVKMIVLPQLKVWG